MTMTHMLGWWLLAALFWPGGCRTTPSPGQAVKTQYTGFDRNEYPGDARLAELHRSFAFVGYWLNTPPGAGTNTWAGKRASLRDAGFGFLVLFNGRLEAALGESPAELGKSDAADAAAAAKREGFPVGATIFLDQEEGGRLTAAQSAYFFAWTEAVTASGYSAGAYLSGQPAPDGPGKTITTADDVKQQLAHRGLHPLALWVYNDTCPPSPGCTLSAPAVKESGTPEAMAWQYAQSPRRPAQTNTCAKTYGDDGLCYANATSDLFLDLDVATSADPSRGR